MTNNGSLSQRAVLLALVWMGCMASCSAQLTLDAYFQALAATGEFSGNVLVAHEGKVLYENSFGFSDRSRGRMNRPETAFPIASISQQFTALGILQQVEQHKLGIADPASKYLPWLPYREVTLLDLLSHMSGLPDEYQYFQKLAEKDPQRIFTRADIESVIGSEPAESWSHPGDRRKFSEINGLVLALVLEKVSGETYEQYIAHHILAPAGMTHTRLLQVPPPFIRMPLSEDFAFPHVRPYYFSNQFMRSNTIPYLRADDRYYRFEGFGDYVSTVRDLLQFDEALYSGKLLSRAWLEESTDAVALNGGGDNEVLYGLGWLIEKDISHGIVVYASGRMTGLDCILLRDVSHRQTVVLFNNADGSALTDANNALKVLNRFPVEMPRKSAAREYVIAALHMSPEQARRELDQMLADKAHFRFDPEELNWMGDELMESFNNYRLPAQTNLSVAVTVLRTNTELFPTNSNAWDSYGEALQRSGRKKEALAAYSKSVELNPQNQRGLKAITELSKP